MRPQTVHLFVFDSLSDWEASYAIAGINSPATPSAAGRYEVRTVGISHAPVMTSERGATFEGSTLKDR